MKYGKLSIIFILSVFLLCGCAGIREGTVPKVISPQNNELSVKGQWKIQNYLNGDKYSSAKSEVKSLLGKKVQLSSKAISFGDYYWTNPTYKIKNVDANEYFLYEYKFTSKELGIDSEKVNVITVTSSDKYLYDFALICNDTMFVKVDDVIFCLKKISNTVDLKNISSLKNWNEVISNERQDSLLRSGVIIGMRTPQGDGNYTYRCFWISSVNKKINPVIKIDNIILPRRSGFWQVDVKNVTRGGICRDVIDTYNISKQIKMNKSLQRNVQKSDKAETNLHKKILYIGNDYISLEITGSKAYKDRYVLEPIDSTENNNGILIYDIDERNGKQAMDSGIASILKEKGIVSNQVINDGSIYENFALYRKTGHWFIKGRLYYNNDNTQRCLDYNINLIPSSKIVFYDNLCLPWTDIKDKVPEAIDAFTSPNEDIAVILTQDKLYVYSINGNKLSENALYKTNLNHGECAIMSEWATGSYVQKWGDVIKSRNQ